MCLCITDTEQFIETIRKYPCVWDKEATVYKDNELKGKAWEQIAAKHGLQSETAAKKEWKKLRDRLREVMKRQKTITGKQRTNVKPWKYQKQMEFLIPQMKSRKRVCNLVSPQQSEHSGEEECVNSPAERTHSIQGEAIEQDPREREEESEKIKKKLKHEQKRCRISENESNSIINFFKQQPETNENRRLIEQNDDPLLGFFQSMYKSTKVLPRSSQLKIKRQLFDIVLEEEERVEASKQNIRSASLPSQFSSSHAFPSRSSTPLSYISAPSFL